MDRHKATTTITVRLPVNDAEALRQAAKRAGVSVNSLLLASVQARAEDARGYLLKSAE